MDIKLATGSSVDYRHPHDLLLRRPKPENGPFSISDILLLLRARVILWLGSAFGGRVWENSGLVHTILLTMISLPQHQLLSTPAALASESLVPTSSLHIHSSMQPCKLLCVTQFFFFPNRFTRKYLWQGGIGLA